MGRVDARKMLLPALALLLAGAPSAAWSAQAPARWAGAWGYAPADADPNMDEVLPPGTYRYRAKLTQSGSALMLTFSNAEGREAVAIAGASIGMARAAAGLDMDPATIRSLTFSGQAGAALPVGRSVLSDAVPLAADVGKEVVISVTFSTPTRPARTNLGLPMGFAPGLAKDGEPGAARFQPIRARAYLSLIAVRDPAAPCTIVAFGDSITDGFLADSAVTRGWPGRLAERIAALPPQQRCGVVNMGISGNRVLKDGRAVSALDRFWRDVASVPGATHVILLEGTNDIGAGGANGNPAVTPDMITDGYRQFVARGHALGLKVIGATMIQARKAGYMSPEKDLTRKAVNQFVRTSGIFDGVIDFEAATRDPASPDDLDPAFDPGDHLHPNDAGYKAMGDAIDLGLFAPSASAGR